MSGGSALGIADRLETAEPALRLVALGDDRGGAPVLGPLRVDRVEAFVVHAQVRVVDEDDQVVRLGRGFAGGDGRLRDAGLELEGVADDDPTQRDLSLMLDQHEGHQRATVADRVDPVIKAREDQVHELVRRFRHVSTLRSARLRGEAQA